MKKFHFPLGRILKLHEKTEERLRIKVAMTQAELRKLMNKDGMLQDAATHAEVEAESMSKASAMARAYLDNLIRGRRRIAGAIVRAEEEVQSAVALWRIARQRRMSLERLQELRFEEYFTENNVSFSPVHARKDPSVPDSRTYDLLLVPMQDLNPYLESKMKEVKVADLNGQPVLRLYELSRP